MTLNPLDEARRMLPRWRTAGSAASSSELVGTGGQLVGSVQTQSLSEQLAAWEESPGDGTAADLISAAIVCGRPELAIRAAEFVRERITDESFPIRYLADRIIGADSRDVPSDQLGDTGEFRAFGPDSIAVAARLAIALLRRRLVSDPRNAVARVDLARAYSSLGLNDQARRSINAAVSLAPQSRFILRSASRFFVHDHDPERAHRIVVRGGRANSDPWLAAAEIAAATAAQRQSVVLKPARRMLESNAFSPLETSELAGALATLELSAGNARKARKLFGRALLNPTENVVAQAEWARQSPSQLDIGPTSSSVARAFEAQALKLSASGDWVEAVRWTLRWHQDEPFSHRPAILGSYVASAALADDAMAARFARAGLLANPHDAILLNNLAYSLARQGHHEEALEQAKRALPIAQASDRLALIATIGLIAYRTGDSDLGAELYERAIAQARAKKDMSRLAVGLINWAAEAIAAGDSRGRRIFHEALDAARLVTESRVVAAMAARLAESPPKDSPTVSVAGHPEIQLRLRIKPSEIR